MTDESLTTTARRSVLKAAAGASALAGVGVGAGAGVGAAPAGATTTSGDDSTRVATYACGKGRPTTCHVDVCDWAPSVLTAQNCEDDTVLLEFSSSEKASGTRVMDASDLEETGDSVRAELGAGDRVSIFFSGSVRRLETGDGDLNIAISQRDRDVTMKEVSDDEKADHDDYEKTTEKETKTTRKTERGEPTDGDGDGDGDADISVEQEQDVTVDQQQDVTIEVHESTDADDENDSDD